MKNHTWKLDQGYYLRFSHNRWRCKWCHQVHLSVKKPRPNTAPTFHYSSRGVVGEPKRDCEYYRKMLVRQIHES